MFGAFTQQTLSKGRSAGNRRTVVCANGSIVHAPAILLPHALTYAVFNSGSPGSLLIATNLSTPEEWTVPAPIIEPGPHSLVLQEIRRRATVSARLHRQTVWANATDRRPYVTCNVYKSTILSVVSELILLLKSGTIQYRQANFAVIGITGVSDTLLKILFQYHHCYRRFFCQK